METLLHRRRGTRVRAQIPVRVTGMDQAASFAENCHTLLVNPQGCGVRLSRPLSAGLPVRLENLPGGGSVTARVATSLPPAKGSKYWVVGIRLDAPGNLWCVAPVPQDWGAYAPPPKFFPASLAAG